MIKSILKRVDFISTLFLWLSYPKPEIKIAAAPSGNRCCIRLLLWPFSCSRMR